jgi:hypothetical protein
MTAGLMFVAGQGFDSIMAVCPSGQDVFGEPSSCARAAVARPSPVDRTVASAAYPTRVRIVDRCMVILP